MGILVALLVVAVRAADIQAREDVSDQRAEKIAQIKLIQETLDESDFRREGLGDFRPDVLKRLQASRDRRAHVLTSIRDLEKTADQLAQQFERLDLTPDDAPQTIDQLDEEIASLKDRVLAGREQLTTLKQQEPTQNVVYSVVPTEAFGTTHRRPIYIECVNNRLIIQPHGIELKVDDFVRPIAVGNPLDAAMIAVRDYWNQYNLSGSDGDPYPLLVIRPSGAKAYALARHAIQSWDDEFGYELVEEDLPLDFGKRDRQLEEQLQLAIVDAMSRQRQMGRLPVYARTNGRPGSRGFNRDRRLSGDQYTGLTANSSQGGFAYQGSIAEDPLESRLGYNRNGFDSKEAESNGRSSMVGQSQTQKAQAAAELHSSTASNSMSELQNGQAGGAQAGSNIESLSQTRGRDWALPSRTDGGNVYRRPIKISCSSNQLLIQSGASLNNQAYEIPMAGSTQEGIDSLINAVWRTIESWGFAGSDGYWKPELRIHVLPGGHLRAEELKVLLSNSGLDIELIEAP